MHHFIEAITNTKGDALIGYYVKLFDAAGNAVSLYADESGTAISSVSGIANAAEVDSDGNVSAYLSSPGDYTLAIYATDGVTEVKRIPDYPIGMTVVTAAAGSSVNSIGALAAIANPVAGQSAFLTATGREGLFVFDTSDQSANVTADPSQGRYVAPSASPTGALGAWVRADKFITPQMLGAPFSSSVVNNAALTSGGGLNLLPAGSKTAGANAFILTDDWTLQGPGQLTAPTVNAPALFLGAYDYALTIQRPRISGVRFKTAADGTTDDSSFLLLQQTNGARIIGNTFDDCWTGIQCGYSNSNPAVPTATPYGRTINAVVAFNYIHDADCMGIEIIRSDNVLAIGNIVENGGVIGTPAVLGGASLHGLRWACQPDGEEGRGNIAVANSIRDRGFHGHSIQHWIHHSVIAGSFYENCTQGGIIAYRASGEPAWAGYNVISTSVVKDSGNYGVLLDWMTSCAVSGVLVEGSALYGLATTQAGEKSKHRIDGASHNSASSGLVIGSNRNFATVLTADNAAGSGASITGSNNLYTGLVSSEVSTHVSITGSNNAGTIVTASDTLTNTALSVATGARNCYSGALTGKAAIFSNENDLTLTTGAAGSGALVCSGSANNLRGVYEGASTLSGDDNQLDALIIGALSVPSGADGNTIRGRVTGALTVGGNNNRVFAEIEGAITNTGTDNLQVMMTDLSGPVAKSATYTETLTYGERIILASGTFTINLPTAVGNRARYTVKLVSAGTVTIDPAGAELIDGAATLAISTLWQSKTFVSNGTSWFVIATG